MTFAIVWNRLIARRHAIDAMLEMSTPLASQQLHRPPMWDIWVMPDKQPPPWLDIKVSKSFGCSHDLATNQPTFLDSQWQFKSAIILQVHLELL